MRIEAGVATLLDAPLPGFWNEDVLDVVDILEGGAPRHMAAIRRDRLRSLLDIALVDGDLGTVRMAEDGLRISGSALSPSLAGGFAQAWGRRIVG